MILISLLPAEEKSSSYQCQLFLKKIFWILLIIFLPASLFFRLQASHRSQEYSELTRELSVIKPSLIKAQKQISKAREDILPDKLFFYRFERPLAQFDRLMQISSRYLPANVWLDSFEIQAEQKIFLRLSGRAHNIGEASAIISVGSYPIKLKDHLEAQAKELGVDAQVLVAASTREDSFQGQTATRIDLRLDIQ